MLYNRFKLMAGFRVTVSMLVALIIAISSAGATAHCPDLSTKTKSDNHYAGQANHGLEEKNDGGAQHGTVGHSHNDPKKKKGSESATVCAGSGVALIAQCKIDVCPRLTTAVFAVTAQSILSLSFPPPSEPPRI